MMDTPPVPVGMVSSPKPMQTFDDSSGPTPGGGSRRPGNLWTVEAREDMFNRRESGEGWETICLVWFSLDRFFLLPFGSGCRIARSQNLDESFAQNFDIGFYRATHLTITVEGMIANSPEGLSEKVAACDAAAILSQCPKCLMCIAQYLH